MASNRPYGALLIYPPPGISKYFSSHDRASAIAQRMSGVRPQSGLIITSTAWPEGCLNHSSVVPDSSTAVITPLRTLEP